MNFVLKYFNISNKYDLIIPNIFIGNILSLKDEEFLKNISLIINCTNNIPFPKNYSGDKIRIPIDDNIIFRNFDILKHLNHLNKIEENICINKNILIHCHAGSQRSATYLLLYLVKFKKINLDTAINIIKQKRPICFFPINNFNHIFKELKF